jgi:hypothetical protein
MANMNFRALAAQALAEATTEAIAEDVRQIEEQAAAAREWFVHQFKMEPDSVEGNHVTIDGVTLIYHDYVHLKGRWRMWRVLGTCPKCGGEAVSKEVGDLADFGRILDAFVPNDGHQCAVEPQEDLPLDMRLVLALERCANALEAHAAAMY